MDAKQYPPRCSAKIIANHISFFAKFRRITVECSCNGKCSYKGKIYTSCMNNGMTVLIIKNVLFHNVQQMCMETIPVNQM